MGIEIPDEELLRVLIGAEGARRVLARLQDLADLPRMLREGDSLGLSPRQQDRLRAALELARRAAHPRQERPLASSPEAAAALLQDMADLEQETLRALLLDTRRRVIAIPTIYIGNVNAAIVRPAEVFREAIRRNAVSLIVAHNHPSGDPSPSPEDIAITRDLVAAGQLLGIEVLDHLIIGRGRFVSLARMHPGIFPGSPDGAGGTVRPHPETSGPPVRGGRPPVSARQLSLPWPGPGRGG